MMSVLQIYRQLRYRTSNNRFVIFERFRTIPSENEKLHTASGHVHSSAARLFSCIYGDAYSARKVHFSEARCKET